MKTASKNKVVWGFLLILTTIVGFIWLKSSMGAATDTIGTTMVHSGDLIQRVTISGTIQPARKTLITASYKGYVRKIYVKLGDNVKAGDPIASVGTSLTNLEPVFPLRAPFAGKVVQVMKSEGEFVKEADPTDYIARIDDLSKLYVDANAPEIDRVKIQIGQTATVKAAAILDHTYTAVVRELTLAARETDKWQRSSVVEFPIRLELTQFDNKIEPGMSVLIDIVTFKKEKVLTLAHEYIGREKDQYFVTLSDGQKKYVKLGQQNEEMAEVTEGLHEGDVVRKVDFAKLIGDE